MGVVWEAPRSRRSTLYEDLEELAPERSSRQWTISMKGYLEHVSSEGLYVCCTETRGMAVGMAWSQQGFVCRPEMLALTLLEVETPCRRVVW